MTTLLYRGHAYEQSPAGVVDARQLRYDRNLYLKRQQQLRSSHNLTYRGCPYTNESPSIRDRQGRFTYRGVPYTR